MAIKHFLTATLVGTLLGALEGVALFSVLLVIEGRQEGGFAMGGLRFWIMLSFIMGAICGGIVGAIIGVLVALLKARRFNGLLVGMGVGLAATWFVFLLIGDLDLNAGLLALGTLLGGGPIGWLTALLTFRGKDSP